MNPTVMGDAPATMVSGSAAARSAAPRPKGPRVWLDMDQKELDDAYDQMVYAPNRDQLSKRRASNSELVRALLGAPKRVAYGATPNEMLDIYPTTAANAPVSVDFRLNDRDYGPMTGRVREDVECQYGSVDSAPGVEPLAALTQRAHQAFVLRCEAL